MSKQSFALMHNTEQLIQTYGLDRVVFATFTTIDKCYDPAEFQAMWNSLNCNVIKKHFVNGVAVLELHADDSIHLHAILVLPEKFDYSQHQISLIDSAQKAYRNGHKVRSKELYKRVCPVLRNLWKIFRNVTSYGFGRCEFLPIRSRGAVGKYVSKYVTKSQQLIREKFYMKGTRLVRYLGRWGFKKVQNTDKEPNLYEDSAGNLTVKFSNKHVPNANAAREYEGYNRVTHICFSPYGWRSCASKFSFIGQDTFRKCLQSCDKLIQIKLKKDLTILDLQRVFGRKWGYYFGETLSHHIAKCGGDVKLGMLAMSSDVAFRIAKI